MTSKNVFNKKFDFINVKNSEIFQVLKSEKNTIVYVAKKGWLNNMIWCSEMKRLDQTLGKKKAVFDFDQELENDDVKEEFILQM